MKKLLLVALAAVGLASCVQNEELAVASNSSAIAFGDSFVYNATTKADPTTDTSNITNFDVWAFMEEVGGTVLTDEDVTKSGNAWGYTNIQYWAPNRTYYFAALSPMNSANVTETLATDTAAAKLGLGEIEFTNVDGTEDLLYAKEKVTAKGVEALASEGMPAVKMQFQHLLSKVKFTFKNGFTTDNMSVIVKNVRMSVPKSGTIDLAVADYTKGWELGTEALTLQFGDVANTLTFTDKSASTVDTRFTIPAASTQEYTVTFDVEVKAGTVSAFTELNKTATIKGYALEMGKAYNFVAQINAASFGLQPIVFTAEVDEWVPQTPDPAVGHYVSTAAELEAKVNGATEDVTVCLGDDIVGSVMLQEKPGVHVTIDGNGYNYDGEVKIHANSTRNTGAITIKNVNFETETAGVNFVYAVDFGNAQRYSQNITVENCTFTAVAGSAAEHTAVGVQVNSTQNLVVKNCTATNMHSLLQAQSCDMDVLVDGGKTVACKNGVSFGNTARPVIRNSEIDAVGYGIRGDGNASRGALVVENTTITANQGIIIRKVLSNGYSVALGEGVAINAGELYDVVFTSGSDDAAYVAPTKSFAYSSVNNFNVFPVAENAVINVDNTTELQGQLAEGRDVALTTDIAIAKNDTQSNGYGATGIQVLNGQTIDGNGNDISVNAWTTWDSAINTTGGLIKNLNVTGGMRGVFVSHNSTHSEKVILENVVIDGTVYTISCDQGTNQGLEAYNSTFNGWTSYAGTLGAVKFVDCNFGEGQGYAYCRPYAPTEFVNCAFEAGYELEPCATVTFENCTLGGVALTDANLATLVISNIANATIK